MTKKEYEVIRDSIINPRIESGKLNLAILLRGYKSRYKLDTFSAAQRLVVDGAFDDSVEAKMATLQLIYGDEFDESRYLTKDGLLKIKNHQLYMPTVYAQKIAKAIEMMEARGELA